jgi:hypothetical protein
MDNTADIFKKNLLRNLFHDIQMSEITPLKHALVQQQYPGMIAIPVSINIVILMQQFPQTLTCPPPMHADPTASLLLVRCNSCVKWVKIRAPEAPRG